MKRTTDAGRSRGVTAWPILLALFVCVSGSCLGPYAFAASAPPITTTVALVENDPAVARELGAPVEVSLVPARTLRRSPFGAIKGDDHVTLATRVTGSRGRASLRVSAMNIGAQGWSGTFSLETEGKQLLRDGVYVTEGERRLLAGGFARDGAALADTPTR